MISNLSGKTIENPKKRKLIEFAADPIGCKEEQTKLTHNGVAQEGSDDNEFLSAYTM